MSHHHDTFRLPLVATRVVLTTCRNVVQIFWTGIVMDQSSSFVVLPGFVRDYFRRTNIFISAGTLCKAS